MLMSYERIPFLSIRKLSLVCGLLVSVIFLASCQSSQSIPAKNYATVASRTGHHQAREQGSLPNPGLTPGATLDVTNEDVCTPGYTKKVRNVPASIKRQVYTHYQTTYVRGAYEVDHLIPLELGGSNSMRNLWPEAYSLVWGAHLKDQLENRLHQLVCEGSLPLDTAQHWIAEDWIATYQRIFHTEIPRARKEYGQSRSARRRNDYQS
jgi:hypothetical protein